MSKSWRQGRALALQARGLSLIPDARAWRDLRPRLKETYLESGKRGLGEEGRLFESLRIDDLGVKSDFFFSTTGTVAVPNIKMRISRE